MSRFPYLLLDADNTLFDFPRADHHAFHTACLKNNIPFTEENYRLYSHINQGLWAEFDHGKITKDNLIAARFSRFLQALGLDRDANSCNAVHLYTLGMGTFLLPHALDVCRELSKNHELYIITNAVAAVQRSRLAASALAPFITRSFLSEEAGAAKPDIAYFDYVLAQIPGITRKNCLVVGDSLQADMQGANNAGLPCCWYNPNGMPKQSTPQITYEISDLRELLAIV